jgi:hypothetical protein
VEKEVIIIITNLQSQVNFMSEKSVHKQRSLTRVINKLVDGAMSQAILGDGSSTQRRIREQGYANLSERFKPGRMIMAMKPEDREIIKEAKDKDKDQTYFLYRLTPGILKHCLFPIGGYKKEEVRKLAEKMDLPVFAKKDSQEICFVPEKTPEDFLKRYLNISPF